MKNKIYRFNRWLDKNELFKFAFLVTYIAIAMLNLITGSLIAFILMISMICAFTMYRIFIMDGSVNFDRSKYDVPVVGEHVIVKKDFYYDGSFKKHINQFDPGQKPNYWRIPKGTEMTIVEVMETDGDWKITFIDNSQSKRDMCIYYLDTKDYWDTKSNIRNKLLNKLGI